jgi:hypothetical protein
LAEDVRVRHTDLLERLHRCRITDLAGSTSLEAAFAHRLGYRAKALELRLQLGRTELRAEEATEPTVAVMLHIQKQDSLIAVAWDSPAGRGHNQENDSEETL